MAQQETIKFTIRQDGTVTEEVMCVVGTDCENLPKRIEGRLGVVEKDEHKPEYYKNKETVNVEQPLSKWR